MPIEGLKELPMALALPGSLAPGGMPRRRGPARPGFSSLTSGSCTLFPTCQQLLLLHRAGPNPWWLWRWSQSSDDSRHQLMHLFKKMPGFGGDTATQQFSGGTVGSDGVRCICKDPLVMSGVPASMALMALNLAIQIRSWRGSKQPKPALYVWSFGDAIVDSMSQCPKAHRFIESSGKKLGTFCQT